MVSMIARPFDLRRRFAGLALAALAAFAPIVPVAAQDLESFDPDQAFAGQDAASQSGIDGDLVVPGTQVDPVVEPAPLPADTGFDEEFGDFGDAPATTDPTLPPLDSATAEPAAADGAVTYGEDDLIGAAEGVFGKGAEGLARLIEDLLKKQGEPNGYIVGREAGGAFIFGARYGSGTLHHKVEGTQKVYWTGPSVGFDAGANAANTFVLVYNLYDTEDLYKRFAAGEGQAYFVGGLHASYLRRGDVVLIPIRVGAGLRLGVNAGYMRFSKKQRWVPF